MVWNTLHGEPPSIIAHRGASGYRPEHTLEGYTLAIEQGADIIEPDLLLSRDGVLFARHDLGLARSTDIASRTLMVEKARVVDGVRDWWIDDFTAAELNKLRAIQPFPQRDRQYDGRYSLPRFSAVLDLIVRESSHYKRRIGLYPELKHPQHFRTVGLDPVQALSQELKVRQMTGADSCVWLQCFDHAVLREAHAVCGNPSFVLIERLPAQVQSMKLEPWLQSFREWASGIAVAKSMLWNEHGCDSGLVSQAHTVGLAVHAWTFREDQSPQPFSSSAEELQAAFALGVDALFCDFPDRALEIRSRR